jgi:hypothetical protein
MLPAPTEATAMVAAALLRDFLRVILASGFIHDPSFSSDLKS